MDAKKVMLVRRFMRAAQDVLEYRPMWPPVWSLGPNAAERQAAYLETVEDGKRIHKAYFAAREELEAIIEDFDDDVDIPPLPNVPALVADAHDHVLAHATELCAGDREAALLWYRKVNLEEYDGRTPEQVVADGGAAGLLIYMEWLDETGGLWPGPA